MNTELRHLYPTSIILDTMKQSPATVPGATTSTLDKYHKEIDPAGEEHGEDDDIDSIDSTGVESDDEDDSASDDESHTDGDSNDSDDSSWDDGENEGLEEELTLLTVSAHSRSAHSSRPTLNTHSSSFRSLSPKRPTLTVRSESLRFVPGGARPTLQTSLSARSLSPRRVGRRNQVPGMVVTRLSAAAESKKEQLDKLLLDDSSCGRESFFGADTSAKSIDESEAVDGKEDIESTLTQLQASVGSLYGLSVGTDVKKCVPIAGGDLGLVAQDDPMVQKLFGDKRKQPLTIVQSSQHETAETETDEAAQRPWDTLAVILDHKIDSYPAPMWEGYFLEVKDANIQAHTKEMELAIRCEDFGRMRSMLKKGRTLQSCNKHGESTVHLACRRASNKLLKFLMKEGGVTVRVRDDYGRSPLHDTCWSYNDRFDIFKTIVENSPELLFVKDKRGYGPFDYIPKQRWSEWCDFLDREADFMRKVTKWVDLEDMADYSKRMAESSARTDQ